MLSIETSFEEITPVFKELSLIIPKISCSHGEMHENRRFFENKLLFLKETHIFLWCACRVQRMLSIETSFEGITRVFSDLSSIIFIIYYSVGERHENRGFFENKRLFFKDRLVIWIPAC